MFRRARPSRRDAELLLAALAQLARLDASRREAAKK
jgi:hypothetical protein